jgi:hypothetical protein
VSSNREASSWPASWSNRPRGNLNTVLDTPTA